MLAACALKPPMLPAMAEPTRFLRYTTSTIAATVGKEVQERWI
jgi:hypothetical protein